MASYELKEADRLTISGCCRQPVQKGIGAGRRRHYVDDTPRLLQVPDGLPHRSRLPNAFLAQDDKVLLRMFWLKYWEKVTQQRSTRDGGIVT